MNTMRLFRKHIYCPEIIMSSRRLEEGRGWPPEVHPCPVQWQLDGHLLPLTVKPTAWETREHEEDSWHHLAGSAGGSPRTRGPWVGSRAGWS